MESTFSDRLREIINRRHDGRQQALADLIGVNKSAVSSWLSGARNPRDSVINTICDREHVSYTWLTTGEGEMDELPVSDLSDALATLSTWALDDPEYTGELLRLIARQRPEQFHAVAQMAIEMCRRFAAEVNDEKKDGG